jgi:hypothetical protein
LKILLYLLIFRQIIIQNNSEISMSWNHLN